MKHHFFGTKKSDRLIAAVIAVAAIGYLLCLLLLSGRKEDAQSASQEERKDVGALLDSLNRRTYKGYPAPRTYRDRYNHVYELFPFDPNTADSALLCRLGLRPWQVRNLCKYRAKGGRFRKVDDFAKLYGLSQADFNRLRPYIVITAAEAKPYTRTVYVKDTTRRYVEKFTQPVQVDINTADTATLKRIPKIGSGFAAAIVNYRTRLGGYVDVAQLHEIGNFPDGIDQWFCVGREPTAKLDINHLSVEQMRRHPYLNFYQARAIVELRRKYGRIISLKQLSLFDSFTPHDLQRLAPYVALP
jgi:DNA uptake protein ComE-like DNA-binding protein